ncbi:MAG: CaiB/BaiF CoA transferase family protein [Pseudomonadales bacterium]
MPGPLEGFKILDLSAVVSGPLTAGLLADQGAEVIKVERPGGDIQRHVGSSRNGFSGFFHVLNRGKRSIAIDLGKRQGVALVQALARDCDVVIQNFRPGVTERLGIGYSELSAENPGLVYLSISGFGQSGPHAGDRAYDPIIQAYSGIAAVQGRGHREHPDKPEQVNMLLLDKLTAWTGSQAITAALLARSKSGRGQHVELSMLDTAIAFSWMDVAADLILLDDPDAASTADIERRPPIGASGIMQEFEDGWGAVMTLTQSEFEGLCRVYDLPEMATDPRFATLAARTRNRRAWWEVLSGQIAEKAKATDIAHARARMSAEQVPFARVRRLDELPNDEQVQHNATFRQLQHPVAGLLQDAQPAPRFSDTPAAAGGPAPTVGQHTREILEELGLSKEIDELYTNLIVY